MDAQQLAEQIRQLSTEGKVSCQAMLALAEREHVSPAEVGRLCNEMDIRIRACQLGCFK
jgi:hypothetical protein